MNIYTWAGQEYRGKAQLGLEIQRIDLLFRQNYIGIIAGTVNSLALAYVAWGELSHAFLIIWLLILNGTAVLRLIAISRWQHQKQTIQTAKQLKRWHDFMKFALLVPGFGWGTIGWMVAGTKSVELQVITSMLIAGMSAGALTTNSASLPVMYSFLIPASLAFAVRLITLGTGTYMVGGFLALMFVVLLIQSGRNLHNYVNTSLLLNAKLKESEERLRAARDSSSAISWEWQYETGRFFCEGEIAALLGADQALADSTLDQFLALVHPQDRSTLLQRFQGVVQGEVLDAEVRVIWPDGSEHWIAVRGKIHQDDFPKRVSGISWDITTKHSEQSLRHERDVFEAANNAKLMFLANVSHEIRTPLAAINGFAAQILDNYPLVERARQDLQVILRHGKHLVSVVGDLLDLSKSETDPLYLQKSVMSPMQEINDALSVTETALQRGNLRLEVAFTTLIPATITADATRFRQVLINLTTNAVKYTDEGRIRLTIGCMQEAGDGLFSITVTDSGIGMNADTQSHLFQPFARGLCQEVQRIPGSGLGLVLSQSLARRMGGDVRLIRSSPGRGSSFRFTLKTGPLNEVRFFPGEELRSKSTHSHDVHASQNRLAGKRLLLVEDDPDLRELMQRFLRREGAEIEIATNGQEAVDQALRQQFHVILMDIKMPVMDGHRATSLLRSQGYRNSIVALTASASTLDQELCYQAGCDGYLSKPVDNAHLLDVIGNL